MVSTAENLFPRPFVTSDDRTVEVITMTWHIRHCARPFPDSSVPARVCGQTLKNQQISKIPYSISLTSYCSVCTTHVGLLRGNPATRLVPRIAFDLEYRAGAFHETMAAATEVDAQDDAWQASIQACYMCRDRAEEALRKSNGSPLRLDRTMVSEPIPWLGWKRGNDRDCMEAGGFFALSLCVNVLVGIGELVTSHLVAIVS